MFKYSSGIFLKNIRKKCLLNNLFLPELFILLQSKKKAFKIIKNFMTSLIQILHRFLKIPTNSNKLENTFHN
jgi:hypothetical protein